MGKALGFKKNIGDYIDESKIEKKYILENKDNEQEFMSLISNIDFTYIQVVNHIIDYAEMMLKNELTSSIYISLLDHINFAIERFYKNQMFENQLHQEIKRFYPIEYNIGESALKIIETNLGVLLPEDEASFIAMHILNSQINNNYLENTETMTNIIENILKITHDHLDIEFDENSISYERFITHLKFFACRLINEEEPERLDNQVSEVIKKQYNKAYEVSLEIKNYIENHLDKKVSDSELMYLTIHLNVFINRTRK